MKKNVSYIVLIVLVFLLGFAFVFKTNQNRPDDIEPKKCLFFDSFTQNGFFSEYFNLLGAMIWCEDNNMDLYIDESRSNICGFDTYFLPLKAKRIKLKSALQGRHRKSESPDKFLLLGDYLENRYKLATSGVLCDSRKRQYTKKITETYKLNDRLSEKANKEIKRCKNIYGDDFAAFHVRRGDKITEEKNFELNRYIKELQKAEEMKSKKTKNIFVMSDKKEVIEDFKKEFPQYNFFCLHENENEYDAMKFSASTDQERKNYIENFLIDLEIFKSAKCGVVTIHSNVGAFLMLSMHPNCYAIDEDGNNTVLIL
jgi:hypothetical protein